MAKRNQSQNQKPSQVSNSDSPLLKIVLAVIGVLGLIIVALINRSTATLPAEFTQTAEARLTAIMLTIQAIDSTNTSIAMMTQNAEVVRSSTMTFEASLLSQINDTPTATITPSVTPTEIKPVRYDYTVNVDDTLKEISKKFLIVDFYGEAIGRANCNQSPVAGDVLVIKYYYIQPGDTIDVVAERFGAKVGFLRFINNLSPEISTLPAGQILILPGDCSG